jgi:DNA-binding transcriptional LysR family regulator
MGRSEHVSRRLKLRHLNVLLAVVQSGSMAKAARQLAVSQPVVSKAMAELENTLGVRLLDRSSRGIEPTLYGRALIKRSVALLNDLRTSVDELKFLSDPRAGELRIGSSEAVAAGMLGAVIDRLARRHPRIRFEATLGGGLNDLQYRELQAHDIDLIIGRLPSAIPDDVETSILYHEEFSFVTGMQNKWARRRRIAPAELVNEPWCLPSLDVFPWSLVADAFRSHGLAPPDTIVTARSVLLQNSLLATGRFLGILPRSVLHFCAKNLRLKILSVDLPIQPYPVGIVTLKNRTLSPVAQVFIDSAIEVAKPFARRN